MATTFAILAVFIPVAFMSGVIGKFFLQFGITVAVAVLVSLFVSFTLDPMLSSIWPDPKEGRFRRAPWLGRIMERVEEGVDRAASGLRQAAALGARRPALRDSRPRADRASASVRMRRRRAGRARARGCCCCCSPRSRSSAASSSCRWSAPSSCRRTTRASCSCALNTPIGSSLEYTDAKVRDVEATMRELDGVEAIVTTVGTDEGKNYAQIRVRLTDRRTHDRPSQKEIEKTIRETRRAHGRPRAVDQRQQGSADLRLDPRSRHAQAHRAVAGPDGAVREDPRHRGSRELARRARIRPSPCASTTSSRAISGSRPRASATLCGR